MNKETVKESITIDAPASEVWKAITTPETIKQYFFGTNVDTDWKEGSPITYYGTWEGKDYKDKGMILKVEKNKKLRHTHWSSLSNTPDTPENYYTVTYDFQEDRGETILTITQEGQMTQKTAEHSAGNWRMVLQKLKTLLQEKMSVKQ
jgi:uncharacterized protein YndB with AHSA1/START domain